MSDIDKVFAGSIPKLYDTYLVPLIFAPYAADLVRRLRGRTLGRVLEIAAGTGVVIEAYHLCMMMRGVEKQNSRTITSALRGVFRDDARTREEFLSLAHARLGI